MASLDSLLTNPTRLRQYATRDPRVAPEQQLARVGISLNAASQAASGSTGRPTGGPAPRRGSSTRSSGSGLNSLMSRYDKAYDKETQRAAKDEAKAIEDATATAGEVITAIETPTGLLPAQGPSGSPYLVRKPGSSTTLQDPVSGEELVPDVTSPTGLKSITAEKAKVEADKATLRSRKETAKIYEGVQKDIAKEQEAARDEIIGEKTNQYLRQGRKYYLDRVTKEPIPLQSDEEFESEQQKKMAKLAEESRAKQLKRKVANLRIDEDTIQLERKPPTDSEYSKLKEERDTTLEILSGQGLTPDEEGLSKLAGIEGGAEIANKFKDVQSRLKAADEARYELDSIKRKRLDIERQLANPDEWEAEQQNVLQNGTEADLDERIKRDQEVAADLDETIKAESAPIIERDTQLQAELDSADTDLQNALTGDERIAAQRKRDNVLARMSAWEGEAAEAKASLNESVKLRDQRMNNATAAQEMRQTKTIADRKNAIGEIAKTPFLAPVAAKIQALDEEEANRIAGIANLPPEEQENAKAIVADDITKKRAAVDRELKYAAQTMDANLRGLYEKYGRSTRSENWLTENDPQNEGLLFNLMQDAKKVGLTEPQVRQAMEYSAALDWSNPRKLEGDGRKEVFEDVRKLPDGKITVNPRYYLDEEEYKKVVEKADATPEAKANALAIRREVAAPLAARALSELMEDPQMGKWVQENTKGTPLERLEQFNAKLKEGGALGTAYNAFRSGSSSLASSLLGGYAAVTGNETATDAAQYYAQHAQAYGMAQEAAGKGTGTLGRFAGKVVGAAPSLIPAVAIGLASGGLGLGTSASLITSSLASGVQSMGGTHLDAYEAFKDKGYSDAEARSKALAPAITSGLITSTLTQLGGARGVESIFKAATPEAVKAGLKATLANIATNAGEEALEEFSDQALQGLLASATYAPEKPITQALNEAIEAGLIGMALGGGVAAVKGTGGTAPATGETQTPPAAPVPEVPAAESQTAAPVEVLPEVQASLENIIKNFAPDVNTLPQAIKATAKTRGVAKTSQDAARAIVAVAQGKDLATLPSGLLESVGLVRTAKGTIEAKDKKIAPLIEFEKGQAVIRDEAAEWLEQNGQDLLRAQIGKTETERRAEISTPKPAKAEVTPEPQPEPTPTSEPTPTPSPAQPETAPTAEAAPKAKKAVKEAAPKEVKASRPALGKAPPAQRKAIGKGAAGGSSFAEFASITDADAFAYAGNQRKATTGRNLSNDQQKRLATNSREAFARIQKATGIPDADLRGILADYSAEVRQIAKSVESGKPFQAPTLQEFIASKTLPPASQAQEEGGAGIVTQAGEGSISPVTESSVTPAENVSSPVIETKAQQKSGKNLAYWDMPANATHDISAATISQNQAEKYHREGLLSDGGLEINKLARDWLNPFSEIAFAFRKANGENAYAERKKQVESDIKKWTNLAKEASIQRRKDDIRQKTQELADAYKPKASPSIIETQPQDDGKPSGKAEASLGVTKDGKIVRDGYVATAVAELTKDEHKRLVAASKALVDTLRKAEKIKGVRIVITDDPNVETAAANEDGDILINPRLTALNIAKAAKDINRTPKDLVIHELIHELAAQRLPRTYYTALWINLPEATKEASLNEYFRGVKPEDRGKISAHNAGAEFFAQIIEARLKGELASQVWDNQTLTEQVMKMLREYIAALRDLAGLITDPELRGYVNNAADAVESDVRAALKEAGIEEDFLGDTTSKPINEIDQRIADAESVGVILSSADKELIRSTDKKAKDFQRKANALAGASSDPMRKGDAFPMGVGFTKMTKRSAQRIDASVTKAGESVKMSEQAKIASQFVDNLLAGKGTEAEKQTKEAKREVYLRDVVNKLLTAKKGDKISKYTIEKINKDKAGYPLSFNFSGEGIVKGVWDKIDVVKDIFSGDRAKFVQMVDEARSQQQPLSAPRPPSSVTPAQDAEYLAAVESGNMAKAQKMVDDAAKAAGYNVGPVWHGTPDGRFLKQEGIFKSEKGRYGWGRDTGVHWFATSKKTASTYADDRRAFDYQNAEPMVIPAYLKLNNPLEINGSGEQWRTAQTKGRTTNAITEALENGNDGVVIKDVQDDYQTGPKGKSVPTTTYAVFNSQAIKSADPVTLDASGNIIPLSQRFNEESESILYAPRPDAESLAAAAYQPDPAAPSPIGPESDIEAPSDAADQENVRQTLEDMEAYEDLRNDAAAMKALQKQVLAQGAGEMTPDPKNRALMGLTPETRAAQQAALVAQTINGIEIQRHADVFARAREAVATNRTAVDKQLFSKIEADALFDADDIAMAQQITEKMQREITLNPDDAALYNRYLTLTNYWADNKTNVARSLAIMRDPQQTPLERMRQSIAVVGIPPLKVRMQIRAAWTPKQKAAEIAALEKKIKDAENDAQVKLLEAELRRVNEIQSKDEILASYIEENKRLQAEVLKSMNLSNDDVMLNPEDRYAVRQAMMESDGVKAAMAKFSPEQKAAVNLALNGYSDVEISKRTGFKPDEVAKVAENFRQNILKPAIAAEVKKGRTFGSLLESGLNKIRQLLRAPTVDQFGNLVGTGEINTPNAAAIAAEIDRILDFTMQPARRRNRPNSLVAKVVQLPNGQKVRMFIPFDPDDVRAFYRYAREMSTRDSSAFDKVYEYWINGILSGPQTQVANIAGNALQIAWNYTAQRSAEALLNIAYKDPKGAKLGEFPHVFKAFYQSVVPAWNQAKLAWDTEADNTRTEYLNEPLTADFKDSNLDKVGGQRSSIQGTKGRIIRIPGRALRFFDSLFKTGVLHAEASAIAYREGRALGLSGPALEAHMTTRLDQKGNTVWQEAMTVADELLFQSENWATQIADDFVKRRRRVESLEKAKAEAEAKGDSEAVNKIQKQMASAKFVASIMRFLFPFTRTPTNILRVGVRKAGGSAISGLFGVANGFYQMRNGKPFLDTVDAKGNKITGTYNKAAQVKDLSETFLAGMAWATLAGMAEGDDDDDKKMILIIGNRPYGAASAGEKAEVMRKYGGTQVVIFRNSAGDEIARFNYGRYEPFATAAGVIVDTIREIKQAGKTEGGVDAAKLAGSVGAHLIAQAESKSFLQGLAGIARTVEQVRAGQYEPGPALGKSIISGIVPNLIRQSMRNIDDYQRDFKSAGWLHEAFPTGDFAETAIGPGGQPVKKGGNPLSRLLVQVPNAPSKRTAEATIQRYNLRNPGNRIERQPLTSAQLFAYGPDGKTKIPVTDAKDKRAFTELYERIFEQKIRQGIAANPTINLPKPPLKAVSKLEEINSAALKEARERFLRTKLVQQSLNSAK